MLNAAVRAGGSLLVEVLGADGNPIPGFTQQDANILTGDSVAINVTWGGSNNLSSLGDEPIKLRFLMQDAKLYAFQFPVPEPSAFVGLPGTAVAGIVIYLRRSARS